MCDWPNALTHVGEFIVQVLKVRHAHAIAITNVAFENRKRMRVHKFLKCGKVAEAALESWRCFELRDDQGAHLERCEKL